MELTQLDERITLLGRRGALRSLSAASLALLAALGCNGADAKKQGKNGKGGGRNQPQQAPLQAERKRKTKRGPAGPAGPAGSNGVSGWEYVDGPQVGPDEESFKIAHAQCPDGKNVLGGGHHLLAQGGSLAEITVTTSRPAADGGSWIVNAWEDDDSNVGPWALIAYAICANVN